MSLSSPAAARSPELAPPASSHIRRSFTLPARTANRPRVSPPPSSSADGIETLFTHTSTKIVSFTAPGPSPQSATSRRDSASASGDNTSADPIPWRSATERTLAVGVLRIYRVTSSNVSFLNSGSLLHTIFPKSQCWCVDPESIFVLRIRQDSYYRIELPYESDEDKQKAQEFKAVLAQVLQYERTTCPFTRRFEVQLPERPKTPPRRLPKKAPEKAKKWLFDKAWVPEVTRRPSMPILKGSRSGNTSSHEEDDRSNVDTDLSEAVPESPVTVLKNPPAKPLPMRLVLEPAKLLQGIRSVTAPMGVVSASNVAAVSESSRSPVDVDQVGVEGEPEQSAETASLMSSADSFYSLETVGQPSPSPPYLDAEAELMNPWTSQLSLLQEQNQESRSRSRHSREISEATVQATSADNVDSSLPVTPTMDVPSTPSINVHLSSAPSTPPLISDSDEDTLDPSFLDVATPPDNIRMERLTGTSQRRPFSPMPQPQNLFRPSPQAGIGKQFTAALIRKTYELVLGPPAHLVSLMLRIAAKISNGALSFSTYRVRDTSEKIPCSWESDEDEWQEEDDFGIPLSNLEGSNFRRRVFSGELD
ncbi:inheritance of peroxisomes protein 1-domain-containing protein [Massariosphaeria phaeospora]|uniref:Inheritance of peroxisomes protein 1 n=1 Tax=Massariosphaeria phaeospora TaxID=100035 RepID=A0A7C8IF48_9PLEO|nr:inheritance of peroxisomes protein 1-domain-containing protein [Massariosphaeria phaeospora]